MYGAYGYAIGNNRFRHKPASAYPVIGHDIDSTSNIGSTKMMYRGITPDVVQSVKDTSTHTKMMYRGTLQPMNSTISMGHRLSTPTSTYPVIEHNIDSTPNTGSTKMMYRSTAPGIRVVQPTLDMVNDQRMVSNMEIQTISKLPTPYSSTMPTNRGFVPMLKWMHDNHMYKSMYVDMGHTDVYTIMFPSKKPNAPVLFFNPGGPGVSGLGLIFQSYLPYIYDRKDDIWVPNTKEVDLTKDFTLVYIDFPADVGYSQVKIPTMYGDKESTTMVVGVIKVLLKTYNLSSRELDFFGYSYAGKIWPRVAAQLKKDGYNVGGIAIFSGYTDPVLQEIRPLTEYLYYTGAIGQDDYKYYEAITNKIESLLTMDPPKYEEANKLYSLIEDNLIRGKTGLRTYDIKDDMFESGGTVGKQNDIKTSYMFDDEEVKSLLGAKGDYNDESKLVIPLLSYDGFLSTARSDLKYLGDNGVFILYFMGSMDASTMAKGTRDMMTDLFGKPSMEDLWTYRPITKLDVEPDTDTNVVYGKIATIKPTIYYGTIYSEGHAFDGTRGTECFNMVMQFLRDKKVYYYTTNK